MTTMEPPHGFTNLAAAHDATQNTFISVVGFVVDLMAPTLISSSRDWTCKFNILDRSLHYQQFAGEGLEVRYFQKERSKLPQVHNIGDVVLLRNVKITDYQGRKLALSNFQTEVVVFPSSSIPSPNFRIAYQDKQMLERLGVELNVRKVSPAEQDYVISLKDDMSKLLEGVHVKRAREQELANVTRAHLQASTVDHPAKKQKISGSFGAKFKCIKELQHEKEYANICGIVVKMIATTSYNGVDLYVSDYTINKSLRRYPPPEAEEGEGARDGDQFGYNEQSKKVFPGPYDYRVLKVNLKPPHAQFASKHVREGDIVSIQNVKTHIVQPGMWLECDLWPDHKFTEKIGIRTLADHRLPEVQAIIQRKDEYWKKRDAMLAQKQKIHENGGLTKKALAKLEKKERNRKRRDDAQIGDSTKNPHVRCSYEEIAVTRIKDIRDAMNQRHTNCSPDGSSYALPFINANYRVQARVVDYEPKTLEDFATPTMQDESDSIDSMAWQYESQSYEWHFALLLEDASLGRKASTSDRQDSQLWVQVHHEQAQFLLGNDMDDPEDLRHNSQLLSKLREKMFLLWGGLEETGGESVSEHPFECCVAEYGVEMDEEDAAKESTLMGWHKLYSMFGTTIL